MLDSRVRELLVEYQRGTLTTEAAAQRLLQVRRELGCLAIHEASNADTASRLLVARYAELVRDELGE